MANVQLKLHEVRDGVQFYLITYSTETANVGYLARYSDLETLKSQITTPLKGEFPKKSFFSSTLKDPAKIEERRALLEKWFASALPHETKVMNDFMQQQIQKYGNFAPSPSPSSTPAPVTPVEPAKKEPPTPKLPPFSPECADKPATLYANSTSGFRRYNREKGNWPSITQMMTCFQGKYFNRCILNVTREEIELYYIPWGIDLKIPFSEEDSYGDGGIYNNTLWRLSRNKGIGFYDIRTNSWDFNPLPTKPTFGAKHLRIAACQAGENIHLMNGYAHLAFNVPTQTWFTLKTPNIFSKEGYEHETQAILAREFIFYIHGETVYKYNICSDVWDILRQPEVPPGKKLMRMTWDKQSIVYLWAQDGKEGHALNLDDPTGEWKAMVNLCVESNMHIFLPFCTNDFDEDQELDTEFEDNLLGFIMRNPGPWDKIYAQDSIDEEGRDALKMFDSLPVSERLQFFKKNTDYHVDLFKKVFKISLASSRVKSFIFQILRADPDYGRCFAEIATSQFSVGTRKRDGTPIYFPRFGSAYQGEYISFEDKQSATKSPAGGGIFLNGNVFINGVQVGNLAAQQQASTPSSASSSSSSSSSTTSTTTTTTPSVPRAPELIPEILSEEENTKRAQIVQRIKDRSIEVPEPLICPITQTIFFDPVCTMDGHTYEKTAIVAWFVQGNKTSPLTNQTLPNTQIIPAYVVKNMVNLFLQQNYLMN